jgi:hypothetical protein
MAASTTASAESKSRDLMFIDSRLSFVGLINTGQSDGILRERPEDVPGSGCAAVQPSCLPASYHKKWWRYDSKEIITKN